MPTSYAINWESNDLSSGEQNEDVISGSMGNPIRFPAPKRLVSTSCSIITYHGSVAPLEIVREPIVSVQLFDINPIVPKISDYVPTVGFGNMLTTDSIGIPINASTIFPFVEMSEFRVKILSFLMHTEINFYYFDMKLILTFD